MRHALNNHWFKQATSLWPQLLAFPSTASFVDSISLISYAYFDHYLAFMSTNRSPMGVFMHELIVLSRPLSNPFIHWWVPEEKMKISVLQKYTSPFSAVLKFFLCQFIFPVLIRFILDFAEWLHLSTERLLWLSCFEWNFTVLVLRISWKMKAMVMMRSFWHFERKRRLRRLVVLSL